MKTETQTQEFTLEQLRALYCLAQSLNSAQGYNDVVTAFVGKLRDIVPYESCAVILADNNGRDFEITHAAGEHGASLVGRRIKPGEGISGWVVANRHPFCNTDPKLDLPSTLFEQFADYQTLAIFPILRDNDLFGAVTLYSSSLSKYDSTHQRLMAEAISLLGLAISGLPEGMRLKATHEREVGESWLPGGFRIPRQQVAADTRLHESIN